MPASMADAISIDDLRAKLPKFVQEKLSADEDAFRADVKRAIEGLMATPIEALLEGPRVEAAFDAALAKDQVERGARPLSRAIQLAIVRGMRSDATKLGDFVPEKARARIDKLLEKKRTVNEKLIRQLIEQEAMEET